MVLTRRDNVVATSVGPVFWASAELDLATLEESELYINRQMRLKQRLMFGSHRGDGASWLRSDDIFAAKEEEIMLLG